MELEFDRDVMEGYQVIADDTICQEETMEAIVPDACPDILRIVDTLLGVAAVALIFVIKKFLLSREDSTPPPDILGRFFGGRSVQKEETHHE